MSALKLRARAPLAVPLIARLGSLPCVHAQVRFANGAVTELLPTRFTSRLPGMGECARLQVRRRPRPGQLQGLGQATRPPMARDG
jgi:hypothetical protein